MANKPTVDKELIRDLATLMDETGLTEIELGDGPTRLRVARGGVSMMAAPPPMAAAQAIPVMGTNEPTAGSDLSGLPGAVNSPMVGTVYVAPEPGLPAFVKVGDVVTAGQTLLIIEAMKTMNTIPAPINGKVSQILIGDGTPVEFGETLIVIE
ncbi:MAG: acetyl-CoA carboxylase, biotin carboxyl carrier protein [Alphaproteobacteria bacterium]|jgi:acetyl-CoA carboxylase biotin carboxyl carrier protein|nr:acetyl-CoA carboxylase, biotin carboxyl carrier protein [Alphaproteobacteria bacterium]MBT4019270.1 acetyl-CoA carboxylase, biotin carboxyl carrier protein [Alphaproteobacteria bacterium]MBT4966521.1 acetyl-CoA carboxylase, biotin carboxyl carrier protein [Alphaproteobacteria bacterium]MBT5159924.1 acetyl-CoA carboxylase, biotin carboxyl carrier protein [Alphaproteobacteria bacterium]MBT5918128.1 acetyl-CoA carboxylase, biotin carboxyl carrier protein [Alphaproteobacteria bacterium]